MRNLKLNKGVNFFKNCTGNLYDEQKSYNNIYII